LAVVTESKSTYIWDMQNSNEPLHVFPYASPAVCIRYHPKDNKIVTGHENGQIAVWDSKVSGPPKSVSSPELSHRDIVTSIQWIHTKVGTEFLSVSLDMTIKLWNSAQVEAPLEVIDVGVPLTFIEYDPSMPTKFTLGAKNGYIISGNRRGSTLQEKLPWRMKVGDGPVEIIERNKAFSKIFLTLADGDVKIWSEDCKDCPIFTIPKTATHFTGAAWSPTRFSVIAVARSDNYIDAWDFIESRNQPLHTSWIDNGIMLTMVAFDNIGKCIAVGGTNGTAYRVQLSENFVNMTHEERAELSLWFENDVAAYKGLDAKLREAKMKAHGGKGVLKSDDHDEVEEEYEVGINPEEAGLQYLRTLEESENISD